MFSAEQLLAQALTFCLVLSQPGNEDKARRTQLLSEISSVHVCCVRLVSSYDQFLLRPVPQNKTSSSLPLILPQTSYDPRLPRGRSPPRNPVSRPLFCRVPPPGMRSIHPHKCHSVTMLTGAERVVTDPGGARQPGPAVGLHRGRAPRLLEAGAVEAGAVSPTGTAARVPRPR